MRPDPVDRARPRTRSASRARLVNQPTARASNHKKFKVEPDVNMDAEDDDDEGDDDDNDDDNDDDERDPENAAYDAGGSDDDMEQEENLVDEDEVMAEMEEEGEELQGIRTQLSRGRIRSQSRSRAPSRRNSSVGFVPNVREPFVGRPAANLSDVDKFVVLMKHRHYSNAQIADNLNRQFEGVNLETGKVLDRYARILKAEEEELDYDLDNGLKEWAEGHDENLVQAYENVQEDIDRQIERLQERRPKMLAEAMHTINPNYRYSARACIERYCALVDGTAYVPIDPDSEHGKKRAAALKMKVEEHTAKELERKEAYDQEVMREEDLFRQRKEIERKKKQELADKKIRRVEAERDKALNMAAEKTAALIAAQRSAKNLVHRTSDASRRAEATDDMNDDPRRELTKPQLKQLCEEKGLNALGGSKLQMLGRIRTHDLSMSNKVLKETCLRLGRPTGGTKDQLLYRIADHDARRFPGVMKVTNTNRRGTLPSLELEEEEETVIDDEDGIRMARAQSIAMPSMKILGL